ncbi:hypothetical protein ILUMI_02542 [Ignelater luminosus]|uniref:Chromo domain-containing protein n=1 Tax=Ignelater luminosus TaxID=2038154 RepID=A0A8K0DCE1_IGNLU|nr:hypothetical protein ILUMI_02542 [Ignelater luminosus]
MEEEVPDPLELCKNPQIIRDAQQEIGKLDVLVCGECHDVFHYIEAFQEHRQKGKCTQVSTVRDNYKHEGKAQVWAFMLWKCAQQRRAKEGESLPTSWAIYQRWCKLSSEYKDTWVVAGNTIQSFTKISSAKVQEIKAKIAASKNKAANISKNNDEDPLEEGEIRLSQLTNAQRVAIKAQVASNKTNLEVDPLADVRDSEGDTEEEIEKMKKNNDATKKTPFKPVQIGNDVTVSYKKTDMKKALRTTKTDTTEETTIEKIISRRFNHKKKCMEYLIKWENMNENENTWEPKLHLEKCKSLVEEFDRLFVKPKTPKLQKRVDESHSEQSEAEELVGRPQRTSKQKALNQVKVWCGDITEGDEASGKRKSFSDDDDSSDSFEKKIKLEEETDSSEDEKPSVTIRRIVKASNSVNGVTKKTDGTLTSTPQRVLRVSQKQLPSLSSGVYIMSKTEGIIKLDSNTSPSASNPLLRVGPKIGQTHIKVVKKDARSPSSIAKTPTKTVPKLLRPADVKTPTSALKPTNKILSRKIITSTPKMPLKTTDAHTNEKADSKKEKIDEDSDGLEELEFPTDLPLPPPDSPPGEFTLCPLTGKILGQDYPEPEETLPENTSLDNLVKEAVAELPDMDVDACSLETKDKSTEKSEEVVSTPPDNSQTTSSTVTTLTATNSPVISIAVSVPDSTTATSVNTTISTVSTVLSTVVTTSTTNADSTLAKPKSVNTKAVKPHPVPIITPILSDSKIPMKDDMEECIASNTIERNNSSSIITSTTKPKPIARGTSILNAALTNARVTQNPSHIGPSKRILSTPTVRQKVTTINRSPINRPSIARPSPNATIIQKVTPNRPRTVLPKTIIHSEPVLKRTPNLNTYKPASVTRKIGNTSIYKASEKPVKKIAPAPPPSSSVNTIVATLAQPTLVQASQSPALVQTSPTVINMPLLTTDEEQTAVSNTVTPLNEIESLSTLPAETGLADLSTFSLTDSETPLLITGDDGTIYQVAGQNEEGQTILVSEGPDGQRQCVLVSSEPMAEEPQTLMMDTGTTESDELEQALMINTQAEEPEGDGGEESQIVAQIVKADPPSPGGTRKVVLMLPDGNLMMTDVSAEQYAALELDK